MKMRILTIILTLLLTVNSTFANDIDNLQTIEDVRKFLGEKVGGIWTGFLPKHISTDTSSFGKGKFFKIDLDNNGLTDLVVNGEYLFSVHDIGNGKYQCYFIDNFGNPYTLTNIIFKDIVPLLVIKGHDKHYRTLDSPSKQDTLIFKYGTFVEYNSAPSNLEVEEINFMTLGCYGLCPAFELTILSNRQATFKAIKYNDGKKGKYKTNIDTAAFNNLLQIINYINLPALESYYTINASDNQTVTLEIKYNNGQTKTISDYGVTGTFGLRNLYKQLFALPNTQKWKSTRLLRIKG
jgi:hypothetical protein